MRSNSNFLYSFFFEDFVELMDADPFFAEFNKIMRESSQSLMLSQRYVDHQVDLQWVTEIENCMIPLDTIIRNPQKFIAQEEEIVPIELARRIGPESVRHLAQHTSMISRVEGDEVTPERILNVYKEESYATYENRFIFTLLQKLQYFIDKRLQELHSHSNSQAIASISASSQFELEAEQISYKLEMTTTSRSRLTPEMAMQLDADTSDMTAMERIERLQKILYDFQGSTLVKELHGCTLVRPPIMKTNLLTKNQDYKKTLELWQFVESYQKAGFAVSVVDNAVEPSPEYAQQLYAISALCYASLKHHTKTREELEKEKQSQVFNPEVVRRVMRQFLQDFRLDLDEVRQIFTDEVHHASKERVENEERIKKMIDRALAAEKLRRTRIREEEKKRIQQERQKAARERKQKALLAQQAREKAAKEREKAKQARLAQKAKEKAAAQKAKEREKAKQAKLAQRAKEKAAAQKAKEREKAKQAKLAQQAKEKAAARMEKEREKAKQAKLAQKAKEKAADQKAKEQAIAKQAKGKPPVERAKGLELAKQAEPVRQSEEKPLEERIQILKQPLAAREGEEAVKRSAEETQVVLPTVSVEQKSFGSADGTQEKAPAEEKLPLYSISAPREALIAASQGEVRRSVADEQQRGQTTEKQMSGSGRREAAGMQSPLETPASPAGHPAIEKKRPAESGSRVSPEKRKQPTAPAKKPAYSTAESVLQRLRKFMSGSGRR